MVRLIHPLFFIALKLAGYIKLCPKEIQFKLKLDVVIAVKPPLFLSNQQQINQFIVENV